MSLQGRRRLIPAWAGKTAFVGSARFALWAHPRVGGENLVPVLVCLGVWGSSPRGRGKRGEAGYECEPGRLIPAWAGKTTACVIQFTKHRAHPRVGGENGVVVLAWAWRGGSSPRGRGKQASYGPRHALTRLIPAWAGKTSVRCGSSPPTRAHPRVGGENHAANPETPCGGAHPRVGGENALCDLPGSDDAGSSPRGRGKRQVPDLRAPNGRLIPAWAGKTQTRPHRAGRGPAHPRVGGENVVRRFCLILHCGSSPRGRGKLRRLA